MELPNENSRQVFKTRRVRYARADELEVFKLLALKMAKVCLLYTNALFFLKYFFLGVYILTVYKF